MAVPYDYYRIFYYVAQHKSFTRAAEVLGNNQPNITRCMNNLEQDLGCKLFIRTNRGISLTPEGVRLYGRAAVAFEQLRLGENEIREDCSLETGSISIAASETALHLLLLDRLAAFHRAYPGVHLRITNDSTGRRSPAARTGRLCCGHNAFSGKGTAARDYTALFSGNSSLRFRFLPSFRRNETASGCRELSLRLPRNRNQHFFFLSEAVF